MDEIKLVHLFEVEEKALIELMNNKLVIKQMPLLTEAFTIEDCRAFLKSKKQLWDEYGYGPWAFLINGNFSGWGGLQPENGEADFALVLDPKYWGWGQKIFNKVKDWAFNETSIESITVLFPPTRKNSNAMVRIGFVKDGELTINGERFIRFRLNKPSV